MSLKFLLTFLLDLRNVSLDLQIETKKLSLNFQQKLIVGQTLIFHSNFLIYFSKMYTCFLHHKIFEKP